jgi:hypothetical protein
MHTSFGRNACFGSGVLELSIRVGKKLFYLWAEARRQAKRGTLAVTFTNYYRLGAATKIHSRSKPLVGLRNLAWRRRNSIVQTAPGFQRHSAPTIF